MYEFFKAWHRISEKYKNGEITKDEYNAWRYNFLEEQKKS